MYRVAIVIAMFAIVALLARYLMSPSKQNALETAQSWGNLAPWPVDHSALDVTARGGPFSQEFVVRFQLEASAIHAWIASCPGAHGVVPSASGPEDVYLLHPAGGAQFSEVRVDRITGVVIVRVYWS
jgi:hypothetical protein